MLLIACPYCGARPEIEFSYGGEAHLARPADPARSTTRRGRRFLYMRDEHQGRARRALAARARLRPVLQCAARHRHRPISSRPTRPANRADAPGAPGRALSASRSPSGRPHRPHAAAARSRSTARAYDGFAGDTLASALLANGVHLVGRSFKYHRPRGILSRRRRRSRTRS